MAATEHPTWTARHDDIVRAARPALVGLVRRLVDPAEAEDVVQDAFVRLAEHPVKDRPEAEVLAWLRRVCLNLACNRLRDVGRWHARAERSQPPEPSGEDPLNHVLRAEQRAKVHRTLVTLPDKQRDCLLLRHSGLSYAEIALAMDMPASSVGTTLVRAERSFRTRFESED